jgi:Smg protein
MNHNGVIPVLDILIYLFENYMGAQDDLSEGAEGAAEPDRDTLKVELEQAGFAGRDIEQAFAWVESLSKSPMPRPGQRPETRALRVWDATECARLDIECRGYIQHLENLSILNAIQREWVIDRLLALSSEDIDLEQVKWVVLMVLFSQPDQAEAYAQMEDLVFEEQSEHALH